ncbi:hypothetical protein [Aliiroseovarius sp. F47248L]|uniref:hypothetical protein n=1 Tax=Aliiroseovarius sp. F47248L TaxID=2926420 RepID=UPI001FF56658|nr:hypothetical protein [Aliiroseovarius sp. F47248L]MCK0138100.1 hypothetical protein [Aliiroseovarius sp. F47248L]
MASSNPVYTPFCITEVAKLLLEDPDVCAANRQRGALFASLTWGGRNTPELAAHSFIDIVEYGLNQQLNAITSSQLMKRKSIGIGLDWICSLEEDWDLVSVRDFISENLAYLDCELSEELSEYRYISSILRSFNQQTYAAFLLNYWFNCMFRCSSLVAGQLTFGVEHFEPVTV